MNDRNSLTWNRRALERFFFFRRAAREIRQVETKNIFIFPETLNVERRILMKNSEWPPPEMRQNDSEFGGGWGAFLIFKLQQEEPVRVKKWLPEGRNRLQCVD